MQRAAAAGSARLEERAGRGWRRRYRKVEEENKEFADRYIEIEEQNNNLANLYVASYQLHSTLDYQRGHPDRPGDRHQPHRGRGLPHPDGEREDRASSRSETSEGQAPARTSRSRWATADRQRRPRRARTTSRRQVAHREPTPVRGAAGGDPAEDQGQRDRRHLDQQAARPEDARSPRWTTSCSRSSPATPRPRSSRPSSTPTSARKLTTLQGFLDMLKTPAREVSRPRHPRRCPRPTRTACGHG